MEIKVDQSILKLAKLFKKKSGKLYIVGGYIRNAVMGIPPYDVDLCSSLKPDVVAAMLEGTEFKTNIKNAELGTMEIIYQDKVFEYTTMRKELYADTGAHRPESVEFVKSIDVDVERRDFSMNSVYFEVLKGEIVDPKEGLKDIKKRTIKTVIDPNFVFMHDGLRILRMIRFSSELNFKIEPKTFACAHVHRANLSDISGTRKRNELFALLNSSKKYEGYTKKKAPMQGLVKYNKLGLWKFFNLPADRIHYNLAKRTSSENNFLALVIDITSTINPHDKFAFLTNFLGGDGLCFSSEEVDKMTNIVCGYFDAMAKMGNKDYFFKYFNNFPEILPLIKLKSLNLSKKYNFFYKYLVNNKIAIQIKDLDIRGTDIKRNFPNIPQRRYTYILNELLSKVFDGAVRNNKQSLLEEVKNYDY